MLAKTFLMAGGGTGGHVIPALAVARELVARRHAVVFFGTKRGIESRLVTSAGFPIEWIEIGGLKRVGLRQTLITLRQLPVGTLQVMRWIDRNRPAAVFSMGGYAAAPTVLAALLRRIPVVAMEPNALPGATNKWLARFAACTLISFPETSIYFPKGKTEVTGLPVRQEFFDLPTRPPGDEFNVLVTGGSHGSRTLNEASRSSWPFFQRAGFKIHFRLQCGAARQPQLAEEFSKTGLHGEVVGFIDAMPKAFGMADLVVCRSGAGAVAEVAAAGKPSILVPFPFAADDHQLRNAEAMERGGAASLVQDKDMNGEKLFRMVTELAANPGQLLRMSEAARRFARPGAANRAVDILEKVASPPNWH